MDEQLVDALRRRGERGGAPDVEVAIGDARIAASKRRRRRTTVAAALTCVIVVVGAVSAAVALSGSTDHAEVAIAPRDDVPAGWSRYEARSADVSIGIPPGWSTNQHNLQGGPLRPIVSLGSTPEASSVCDTSRPGGGTSVAVYEVIGHVAGSSYTFPEPDRSLDESKVVERPSHFASIEPVTGFGCVNSLVSPDRALQTEVFLFRENGRTFFAVAATNDPPFSEFDPALRVLDTLRVGGESGSPTTTPATRADGPDTALQLRPVIGHVAPEDPAVAVDDATTRADVASCDLARVGPTVPTTAASGVDPSSCVVLAQDGIRYLLGPSQVDGVSVASVSKDFRSGMGWVVDVTFTPNGSRAVDDLARQQFHEQMAMVADGVLVAAPTIQPNQASFSSFEGRIVTSVPDEAAADAVLHALGR